MSVQGRRKAELLEEVRELEERLEHLSAATAEGVFVHEAGRILYLNRSGAEMFGFEPGELLNRNVLELAPPACRLAGRSSQPANVLAPVRDQLRSAARAIGHRLYQSG